MKKGNWVNLCLMAVLSLSMGLAYSAESEAPKKGDADATGGEPMVRTAYEIKIKGAARKLVLEQIDQKLKANEELLKSGECTEAKRGKTRAGGGLLTYNCQKPSAQTDDFFRALLSIRATEDCKKGAPPMTLTTYSYSLPPGCKIYYCCSIVSAVPCLIINPTKPCTACSNYTY